MESYIVSSVARDQAFCSFLFPTIRLEGGNFIDWKDGNSWLLTNETRTREFTARQNLLQPQQNSIDDSFAQTLVLSSFLPYHKLLRFMCHGETY